MHSRRSHTTAPFPLTCLYLLRCWNHTYNSFYSPSFLESLFLSVWTKLQSKCKLNTDSLCETSISKHNVLLFSFNSSFLSSVECWVTTPDLSRGIHLTLIRTCTSPNLTQAHVKSVWRLQMIFLWKFVRVPIS